MPDWVPQVAPTLRQLWHRLFGHPWDRGHESGRLKTDLPHVFQAWTFHVCSCGKRKPFRWLTEQEIREGDWIA